MPYSLAIVRLVGSAPTEVDDSVAEPASAHKAIRTARSLKPWVFICAPAHIGSLRCCARGLDDFRPLRGLGAHVGREFLGRAADRIGPLLHELRAKLRHLQRAHDFALQL